jgi:membrane-associated HD superfamily phosphohydrolase
MAKKTFTLKKLNSFNLVMAGLHFVQAVTVLILSRDFTLPVKTDHLIYNPKTETLDLSQATVFDISLPLLIAVFFFLSSAAHLFIATTYRKRYEVDLKKGINKARWFEYSASASVMIVAISLLVGIYDISILVSVFALTAVMNLMGLVMEVVNQGVSKPSWLSYNIGVFAGAVPWLIIAFYFWASAEYGDASPPTFVYWIFVSIFVFFSSFALNMWLQYNKIGPWKDYVYGERAYIILSLVAKSALAWQVFAGTLRP